MENEKRARDREIFIDDIQKMIQKADYLLLKRTYLLLARNI